MDFDTLTGRAGSIERKMTYVSLNLPGYLLHHSINVPLSKQDIAINDMQENSLYTSFSNGFSSETFKKDY